MTKQTEWELVSEDNYNGYNRSLHRVAVPSGWIYRSLSVKGESICFVPDVVAVNQI